MVTLNKEKGGRVMKNFILLTLITIMSTNVLFSIDEVPIINKISTQIQIREEKNLAKVQPTGIWFSEEEIIDE